MTLHTFGEMPDGRPVRRVVLGRAPGPVLHVLELGAVLHRLDVTLPGGVVRNVLLGHPSVADHLDSTHYLGATVGRYANRIAGARFELDGVEHRLDGHDRGNNLHGGPAGFDTRVWTLLEHDADHAVLELVSPEGDQGFPGELTVRLRIDVGAEAVRSEWTATTTAPTPVNLTTHAYLNLDGEDSDGIDGHVLTVPADLYTPTDATSIPLGDHAPVEGTPFDLRTPTRIGEAVRRDHEQLLLARGIDHNYVVRGEGFREVAALESSDGAVRARLHSDQPGLQVYTGNFLDGAQPGTSGGRYRQGAGLALEPQHFPDSPNRPQWPSTILRPGETYRTVATLEIDTGLSV